MFLLRRTAVKALSTPASSFIIKSRASSFAPPAIFRAQKQWTFAAPQHRRYSVETKGEEQAAAAPVVDEASVAPPPQEPEDVASSTPADVFTETNTAATSTPPRANAHVAPTDKTLYVGNLFFEVTEEQLHKLFSAFGPLAEVRLICDNRGLSRGFGFVNFENAEDAQAAIKNLNQEAFEGRRMIVQLHQRKPRHENFSKPLVAHEPSKTLFIGNMSFEMSDKDLNDLFRGIRNVLDVRVAIDRRTGQPRGFAHADFIDVESAVKAKELLDQKAVYGRSLRVDFSKPGNSYRNDRRRDTADTETAAAE